ncbi:cation-dependent mannose-6-phosphate receptor-like [Branchiostoma floridae]|uniref:Cation-dependent mannose-6-phosphate receptor-like n=1 Tax=Branchiostoma floridae TaxID=7739 RepID=A0A9J7LSJ3_BRAFL|nr:cation-dependent mannose-6-phosphate receptor-like [Branchiostoma floridae]
MFLTLTCVLLLLAGQGFAQNQTTCTKNTACSCTMSDGSGDVNLQFVESGKPTYKDQVATVQKDDYLYSWNPCTPFTEGPAGDQDSCTNMAACQISSDQTNFFGLGTHDSAQFALDSDPTTGESVVSVVYQAASSGRASEVLLKCTTGATVFTVLGEIQQGQYIFQLESPCCCPGAKEGCMGVGISGGTIVLIIAVSVVVVYFVGGMIIMKFVKKAEGLAVIPNSGFWSSLPGYIKEGVLFIVSPCRRSGKYDSI